MHRISKLSIEIDIKCDVFIFSSLREPAPRLVSLDLGVVHESESSEVIPLDLFADRAPQLRHIRLGNIQLLDENLPHALRTVTDLSLDFEGNHTFVFAIFVHCPLLERLTISGTWVFGRPAEECPISLKLVKKLRSLDLARVSHWTWLFRYIPCAHVASVTVPMDDELVAAQLLEHLHGPLALMVVRSGDGLSLHYHAPSSDMTRTFVCRLLAPELVALPPPYVAGQLLSRVTTASSNRSMNSFCAFGRLPACTDVSLLIMDGDALTPPSAALSVPQLGHVGIRSQSEVTLAVDDLNKFLEAAFATEAVPPRVSLDGIALEGDIGVIDRKRFVVAVK